MSHLHGTTQVTILACGLTRWWTPSITERPSSPARSQIETLAPPFLVLCQQGKPIYHFLQQYLDTIQAVTECNRMIVIYDPFILTKNKNPGYWYIAENTVNSQPSEACPSIGVMLKSPYKLKTFIPWSKINITIGIFGCVFCISVFTCFNFWFLNTFHRATFNVVLNFLSWLGK